MKGTPEDKVETAEIEFSKEKTLALNRDEPGSLQDLLFALYERDADRRAAQEFNDAMARFQNECPPIPKTSEARITTKGGTQYGYRYAELDEIAATIGPHLHKNGLSYSWDSSVEGEVLRVVCKLSHVNGHSREAVFSAPTANTNPGMSDLQKHAAALTFGRRQSLVQVLGLTTTDPDADGANVETITDRQIAALENMIEAAGAKRDRFLAYMGVESLDQIRAADFAQAVTALQRKKSEAAK
jgi:hypothetical protein